MSKLIEDLQELEFSKLELMYTPYFAKKEGNFLPELDAIENAIEKKLREIQEYRCKVIEFINNISDEFLQQILFYKYVSRLPFCQIAHSIGNVSEEEVRAVYMKFITEVERMINVQS